MLADMSEDERTLEYLKHGCVGSMELCQVYKWCEQTEQFPNVNIVWCTSIVVLELIAMEHEVMSLDGTTVALYDDLQIAHWNLWADI